MVIPIGDMRVLLPLDVLADPDSLGKVVQDSKRFQVSQSAVALRSLVSGVEGRD